MFTDHEHLAWHSRSAEDSTATGQLPGPAHQPEVPARLVPAAMVPDSGMDGSTGMALACEVTEAIDAMVAADGAMDSRWLDACYRDLCVSLVEQRFSDARVLSALIETALRLDHADPADALGRGRGHVVSFRRLIRGINRVSHGAWGPGIDDLRRVSAGLPCDESMQWVAWVWIAKAAAELLDADLSMTAEHSARQLSRFLDRRASRLEPAPAIDTPNLAPRRFEEWTAELLPDLRGGSAPTNPEVASA